MSSKAIRNGMKATEYKLRMAENKELIQNRVLTYLRAFKEAELRGDFPSALMRINSFEMYDCLGQINDFFEKICDFLLEINANVYFELYDKYCEFLNKLAAQVLHHHIGKRSYKRVIKAFLKKLREIEAAFSITGQKNENLAEKLQTIFLKNNGFWKKLLNKGKSLEKQYEEKKQALEGRISYHKELQEKAYQSNSI